MVKGGDIGLNYGIHLVYRTQSWDQSPAGNATSTVGGTPDPNFFFPRHYTAYIPDIWIHAAYRDMELEVEGTAVLGSIDDLGDIPDAPPSVDLRQYGGVARFLYHFLDGDLSLGLEAGYASGDQWDNQPEGATHISNRRPFPGQGDRTMNQFIFDQDYKIDLILFRELIGAVTNAVYARPSFDYSITDRIRMRVSNVTSFAQRQVSTPGNARGYGIELDGDLEYHNDSFSAGMAYGILFPLAALDHPVSSSTSGGPGFSYGSTSDNAGDAQTAQTIQFRLLLKF